jgi:carboxyl-terminal processing protease
MLKNTVLKSIVLSSCLVGAVFAKEEKKSQEDFYENIYRLNKVLLEINSKYVEEVSADDLTDAAIIGLRQILDPHTAVLNPEASNDLKVSTEGEFGGLGISIALRENVLTIIAPLHGTPAYRMGLLAGDKILKINGVSTVGSELDEAVDKLRGKVGTNVTISVGREGVADLIEFEITRDRIVIKSVPFQGMVSKDVGIVRVASFAQKTSRDVEKAIEDLKTQGMKKLILDLRFNPGGLLSQAIEMSDLFLEKDQLVVSTKGRTQQSEAYSENAPLLGVDVPMVVLVNGGSASASEIVSGAIQDWDRGIILGQNTFGKGSVQTIYPIDHQGHALKMTTAFYYLPKGRCINKPENGVKHNLEVSISGDSTSIDSSKISFKTNNGRTVYSEGGITPDVTVDAKSLDWLEQLIERKNFFFKFVVKNRLRLESKGLKVTPEWEPTEAILKDFKKFLMADTSYTKAKLGADRVLDMLIEVMEADKSISSDSTLRENSDLYKSISALRKKIDSKKANAFGSHNEYLRRGLKREFLLAFLGEQAGTAFIMSYDNQVKEAVKYLDDKKLYDSVLNGSTKEVSTNEPQKEK